MLVATSGRSAATSTSIALPLSDARAVRGLSVSSGLPCTRSVASLGNCATPAGTVEIALDRTSSLVSTASAGSVARPASVRPTCTTDNDVRLARPASG